MAAPASEHSDPEGSGEGEHPKPEESADSDQGRAGGAREGPVGDRVRRERRTAQDGEEADNTADECDDARDLPSVDHET